MAFLLSMLSAKSCCLLLARPSLAESLEDGRRALAVVAPEQLPVVAADAAHGPDLDALGIKKKGNAVRE